MSEKRCHMSMEYNARDLIRALRSVFKINVTEGFPETMTETVNFSAHLFDKIAEAIQEMKEEMKNCVLLSREFELDKNWNHGSKEEQISNAIDELAKKTNLSKEDMAKLTELLKKL